MSRPFHRPTGPRGPVSPLRLLTPVLALSLILAGCGGSDDEPTPAPSSSPSPTESSEPAPAPAEPATWPLTGLEAKKASDVTKHRILVVKVDNVPDAAPQAGIGQADLIVEELVEGGVTRLAAFYNSEMPTEVGPIRSMRASDIGIVPIASTIVTSGAAGVTIARIQGADIPFITEGAKGVYRASGRYAPHNLMANLADISTTTRTPEKRPADYLPWGSEADLPKGGKAVSLAASFGGRTTTWAYQKDGYRNTNTYAAADDQFIADSVLVLRVRTGDAGYLDPSGSYVPETKFEGEGEALLFHGGRVIKGTWAKDRLRSRITLSAKGKDLVVPAGHTFVELVPIDGGGVSYAKK